MRSVSSVLGMLLGLSSSLMSQPSTCVPARQALQGFEAQVEKVRTDWKVPGVAIAIVQRGEVIYAKGHGLRDVEKKLPMTADTMLPIASCTKAFTAALMAGLVEEGKLDWNKPVRTWIPWFKLQDPMATERITPLDLVTHRSGLPRHDGIWSDTQASRKEIVRRLQFLEPSKDFRTDFQYTNAMYVVGGYLVEELTGKTWETNVQERLFTPLGMVRANVSVDALQRDGDFSYPYRRGKDGAPTRVPFEPVTNSAPAGAINASVKALVPWMNLHLGHGPQQGKPVLSPKSLAFLHAPKIITGRPQAHPEITWEGYAAGWLADLYRGQARTYHPGRLNGFASQVTLVPGADLGIAVLTNLENTPVHALLTQYVMDRVLGLEPRDWSERTLKQHEQMAAHAQAAEAEAEAQRHGGTRPSHDLAAYAGVYVHPAYGTLQILSKAGGLQAVYGDMSATLEHWHYDVFQASPTSDPWLQEQAFHFQTGLDGSVGSVALPNLEPSVKPILFVRTSPSPSAKP